MKIYFENYLGAFETSAKNILQNAISNRNEYDIFGHHFSYLWPSVYKFLVRIPPTNRNRKYLKGQRKQLTGKIFQNYVLDLLESASTYKENHAITCILHVL